ALDFRRLLHKFAGTVSALTPRPPPFPHATPMRLQVRLLGPFEACTGTGAGPRLPTRKAAALLAVLAARPGERHGREQLATLLWPESGEAQGRGSLRQTLS